jgi:hypothetical protein
MSTLPFEIGRFVVITEQITSPRGWLFMSRRKGTFLGISNVTQSFACARQTVALRSWLYACGPRPKSLWFQLNFDYEAAKLHVRSTISTIGPNSPS